MSNDKNNLDSASKKQGKKMLFTSSTMSHIENFHRPYINVFEEMGWNVDAVALPTSKSFFSIKNLGAINLQEAAQKRLL